MIFLLPFTVLGNAVLRFFEYLGELSLLLVDSVKSALFYKKRWSQVFSQIVEIGYRSQPVVIVTGVFTGAVLAAQSLAQMEQLMLGPLTGGFVSVAMLRELGPVITALMLSGRVGAAMAAEIGTMKVTEQIDALRSMNIYPTDYLVVPRLLAILISMPLLIIESALCGIMASTVFGTQIGSVNWGHWMAKLEKHTAMEDIYIALTKGAVFGLLIVLVSCHQGLKASNGAYGVGQGTTKAMVFSALAVIVANFFLTLVINQIAPLGFAR